MKWGGQLMNPMSSLLKDIELMILPLLCCLNALSQYCIKYSADGIWGFEDKTNVFVIGILYQVLLEYFMRIS